MATLEIYTNCIFSVFEKKLKEYQFGLDELHDQHTCYIREAELFATECLRRNIDPTIIGAEKAIDIIEKGER